MTFFSA